jgi:hypothetical protein
MCVKKIYFNIRVKYIFSPYILRNCQEWSIHFKNGKKNPISFSVIKNGPFRLFVDPTILILVPIFCEI